MTLQNVVSSNYNKLWRPPTVNNLSMTSQMMWHLATTNCGVLQPQITSSWHLYAFKKVVASGLNKLCCATAAKVTVCTISATRLWIPFNPITIQDVIFWDHMKHFWMSLPLLLCPITLQGGCYNGLKPPSATTLCDSWRLQRVAEGG